MPEMTSLERCMIVFQGGIPDRVPVCLENFMQAASYAGYPVKEYCLNGEKMADAHITTWEHFRHDMIDLENGVTALAQAVGCGVDFYEDDSSPPYVAAPALESIEQVDQLKPIDPYSDAGLPEMIKATRIISEKLGKHVCLLSEGDQGPFSLAAQIIDPQDFLVSLLDPVYEEKVHKLLEYATEQFLIYARALIDAGAHLTMMGESISGPDVCSPRIYKKFAYPYQKHVIETLRAEGKDIGMHICGDATSIIEPMVDTGAIFLQVDYKIDQDVCKQATLGKTTLIGTVNPSEVLALGSPEEVEHVTRMDIDKMASGGGFILSPGCTLPYTTPVENVEVFIQTAHDYGQYGQ